jgi:regulatory protein
MNHKITALTLQKRNRQRVNVSLDGEYAFGLARIVAAWLQVGQEISDEKIAQLQIEDAREVAYQRALQFAQFRPRSETEIRQNLQRHAVTSENIDHTIARMRQSGLLNDAAFAQIWVENRNDLRPRSRRALTFELQRRGVDRQLIEETLLEVDDEALAYQAARQRAGRLKDLEWKDFRLKMFRFLAQRGFDYQVSSSVIARVWEETHSTDYTPEEEDPQ